MVKKQGVLISLERIRYHYHKLFRIGTVEYSSSRVPNISILSIKADFFRRPIRYGMNRRRFHYSGILGWYVEPETF